MKKVSDKDFKTLLTDAKKDPNILGFFLGGSRGKGFHDSKSDYDVRMVVKNSVAVKYKNKYNRRDWVDVDLAIDSLDDFKKYAVWGSGGAWDRYDFTHVKVLVDKTNIQKIVNEKGSIPKSKQRTFIAGSLDAYINGVFRSVKSLDRGDEIGALLEAVNSIPFLLDAVFALEARPRPFYRYLAKELKKYPLKKLSWSSEVFLKKIVKVITSGDLKVQQEILRETEKTFRKFGYGKVFNGWEGKDKWARDYRLKN